MNIQKIYTIEDHIPCEAEEGEGVDRYLLGVFSRIAPAVVAVRMPIDWLVVKSSPLDCVVNGSQNFFDEMLEKALRESGAGEKVSVFRTHGVTCGGAVSNRDIEEWMKSHLQQEFRADYLNEPNLSWYGFVGYHLNMREVGVTK